MPGLTRNPTERAHRQRLVDVTRAIANRLKDARGLRGMSQEDVATAASISVETYRYLESAAEDRARVNPTLDTLLRVAFVLGLDDLIRVDDRGALDEESDDDRDVTP